MAQAIFGAGLMWGTQTTDAQGNPVANANPIMFGTLQEASIEISFDTKMLYGSESQFPKFVGRGKGKMSGKAKMGTIKGSVFGNLFFGQSVDNGLIAVTFDTVGTIIPATPFSKTVTPPNNGDFYSDLDVIYAANTRPLKKVASSPAAGQYSVDPSTGTFQFAAADTGLKVFINYKYTTSSLGAVKSTIASQPMGYAPTFKMDLYLPYNGKSLIFTMNSCIASKLSIGTKLDDYSMPEFDFEAFQDDAGNIGTWSTSD